MTHKSVFSSKIGLVLAAAGSAIGLGNIWKFPYVAGENGGGAFLIVYLVCVAVFGLPLLATELYIGKRSGKSPYNAFRSLRGNNQWQWLGGLCLFSSICFMGFYFVATGWCFSYLTESLTNSFQNMEPASLRAHFSEVVFNHPRMVLFSMIPLLLSSFVVWFDVNKGIERMSKILMPLLIVLMLLMVVRVLMLEGSQTGLRFFLHTDFSAITPTVVLQALGQCFFSLSIGIGTLIMFGAYMPDEQRVSTTAAQVVVLDTLVAFTAGLIIFPAVFAFGFDPAEGPELVFVVLPAVFGQMAFSWLSGILFFGLLCIAAVTSTISLLEMCAAYFCEATANSRHPLNRHKSVLILTVIATVLIITCAYSGKAFTIFDYSISNFLMPLGALSMALFVGWFLPDSQQPDKFSDNRLKRWIWRTYLFLLRYIVPVGIVVIWVNSLL